MTTVEAECRHAWFVASRRYAQFLRMRREYGKITPERARILRDSLAVDAAVYALHNLTALPKVT